MKGPVRNPSTYQFSASAKTLTFLAPVPIFQGQILAVFNLNRQEWIYLPQKAGCGGTWNSPVLTLSFNTATHADGDALQVFYDDGLTSQLVSGAVTAIGPLTNSELRATPLPVSGPFLTNVELRAAPLAVTGALTNSELRATPVAISATALPLPADAATAANQPALGVAGTPSADVLTVQGAAGAQPLKIANGVVGEAQYTFSGAILVNTQLMLLDCSDCSAVSIQVESLGTGGVIAAEWSNNGTTFGSASTASTGLANQAWGSIVSAGLFVVPRLGKLLRLRMSTAASGGTTSLSIALLADSPMVNAVAQLNGGSTQIVGSVVQGYSAASSFAGATKTSIFSAASTNAAVIKGSAGKVLGFWFTNTTANHVPVRLYNLAGVPNVGTSTTFTRIVVPPSGYVTGGLEGGYLHSVGIAIAITAGLADGDSTAVTAGAIIGELFTI